jgi:cyclase
VYAKGLAQVSDACHAYLQPDGGWGWSNAGLVVGDGASLLVDTLFDLRLTAEMLDAMSAVTSTAPIATLVNTHANGDHCYGNSAVDGAEIVASNAAAREMTEVPPSMLAALNAADGEVGALFRRFFGAFDFDGIELRLPDRTFDARLDLDVGGKAIELVEVGPAHTAGDVLVHVPSERVAFTGDILFIGGTPIVWAGPLSNWIAACDLITSWDVDVVVPGHGPVTDKAGVCAVRDELAFIESAARERWDAGMPAAAAAADILRESGGHGLAEQGRIAVNVETAYRSFAAAAGGTHESPNIVALFKLMAELEGWSAS